MQYTYQALKYQVHFDINFTIETSNSKCNVARSLEGQYVTNKCMEP